MLKTVPIHPRCVYAHFLQKCGINPNNLLALSKREWYSFRMPRAKTVKKDVEVASVARKELTPIQKKQIIIIKIIVVVGAFLYFSRSFFIVAMVNNQPITRWSVISELERQSGKKALDSIVSQTIIQQEAAKQKIVIKDAEITAEIKKIETNLSAQGQKLDSALAAQGMTMDELKKQIRIQKTLEALVGQDIKISDKEIDAFIEENKAAIPTGTPAEETRAQVADTLKQDKLSSKIQKWITDHQKSTKIQYFKNY